MQWIMRNDTSYYSNFLSNLILHVDSVCDSFRSMVDISESRRVTSEQHMRYKNGLKRKALKMNALIIIDDVCKVGNHHLLSDAELRENRFQDLVGGDGAGDRAEVVDYLTDLFTQEIGGESVV